MFTAVAYAELVTKLATAFGGDYLKEFIDLVD
jgi:hypothetical protein